MKQLLWQNLPILRFLAGLWGWLTIIIFILDFFNGHLYKSAITNIAIIYGAILAMYVGSKEYRRWKEKKAYQSKHWGELYVVAWTVLMVFFGGRKLPELARGIGDSVREFRKAIKEG